jgi:F420-dependent oxidoreductase-like protein
MERIGLTFNPSRMGSGATDDDLITVAKLADRLGYDTFFTGESWGRDALTILTAVACHTTNLRVGTGILPVFSRTPALIAQSIASLDLISNGRATLGLGTSGKIVIEDWHGLPFQRPLERTREYIEIIRQALGGGPVNHDGNFFQLSKFRMGVTPVQERIPIYLASLGPKNLALTGQMADGWLPIWMHYQLLPKLTEPIATAAAEAGRDMSQITVAPQTMCYTTDDPQELADVQGQVRAHMAYYIAGMGTYYYDLFCRSGFQTEADAVREAWANRERDKAAQAISDQMLEGIAILGDAATCRSRLERLRKSGADMPVVAFPHGSSMEGVKRTLEALAPVSVSVSPDAGS